LATLKVAKQIAAPIERVYALARDVEKFPEIMPDVETVRILSEDGPVRTSEWVGIVRQFKRRLTWTERDVWDDEAHSCVFEQTEGDFEVYRGEWCFVESDGGTMAELALEFELHVPLIGPLIKAVVAKLMKANCDNMLDALAKAAEAGA
jgi:ribosome-associated toxin RatA of RatAB toxin-antitoxin module